MDWFVEALHELHNPYGYGQRFLVDRVVYRDKTEFQDLIVFETPLYGRVMALDGVIQLTEKDEYCYHEMLVHVPLFAHGAAKSICVVGGGDGGMLREALRHPGIERAVLVELDRTVIDVCREHLPSLSDGAFDDPRVEVVIADGVKFMAEPGETFDVMIIDSTDPIGPGEVLFTESFYADCKKHLNPGGILVTQNGVPQFQPEEVTNSFQRLSPSFKDVGFYLTVVPTYVGGFMALGWATDDERLRQVPVEVLADRVAKAGFETRYYTPEVHRAAFALPRFVKDLMRG
ncbi:MAG: polyamine aminopropyltransferase [Magnetovibrionaceae bacterium]